MDRLEALNTLIPHQTIVVYGKGKKGLFRNMSPDRWDDRPVKLIVRRSSLNARIVSIKPESIKEFYDKDRKVEPKFKIPPTQ